MPAYAYRAVDRTGRRLRGREEAASRAALGRALEERGLVVLELDEAEEDAGRARFAGFGFGRRRAVLEVTRALAALLPAGLPVARALGASGNVAAGPLAGVLDAVRARVERGASLAAALGEHPSYFSPLYMGVVRAGERSGDLAGAFRRLAVQLEREEALRARLVSASLYPMLLGLVGGGAVLVLMLFVLPRFVELLEGAGAALPRSTALLLAFSDTLQRFWPVLLALFGAVIGAALTYGRTAAGRRAASHALLRLPVIGGLRRQALAARFARLAGVG